jgi:hypothetical protein
MVQPTETVTRPDPGLARGAWEAPAWALWVMLGVLLALSALYVLRRAGVLGRAAAGPRADGEPRAKGGAPPAEPRPRA